jgi:hypothetical protein
MIKRSFFVLILTIWWLKIAHNSAPARAKPLPTVTPTRSTSTAVDLKLAIDRFFKTGILEESWFSLKEMSAPGKFAEFRKQALDARNIALTLFGTYKNVRSQSNTTYIATFDRRELAIEFQLDSLGKITAISAK